MNDERRAAIVWLLEHRNDHLPFPVRHVETAPGFVNEPRPHTCPDCIANGRVLKTCETCRGSGFVAGDGLDRVAVADELSVAGGSERRDPYAKNGVVPLGFDPTRHDETRERDRQIARLAEQTSPPRSEAQLLDEANRRGYAWEELRRQMYRDHDFAALDRALEQLRTVDVDASRALHAIYVDGWMAEVGQITPLAEQLVEQGLVFLDARLPDPLRVGLHPAAVRIARKQQRLKDAAA